VRLLAVLLFPWTLLLALAPATYFPTPWVKWGWVGFDLLLAAALLRLTQNYAPLLATILTVLVTCDAALTFVEVLLYNLAHARSIADILFSIAAVLGPSLSAFLLWRGRLHRQKSEPD